MKEDFKPFLPLIIPSLLNDAQRSIDFKIVDVDDGETAADDDESKKNEALHIKVKGFEGTK